MIVNGLCEDGRIKELADNDKRKDKLHTLGTFDIPPSMPPKSKSTNAERVTCRCQCGRQVHPKTEQRHMTGKGVLRIRATAAQNNEELFGSSHAGSKHHIPSIDDEEKTSKRPRRRRELDAAAQPTIHTDHWHLEDNVPELATANDQHSSLPQEEPMPELPTQTGISGGADDSDAALLSRAMENLNHIPRCRVTVEDVDDDEEEGDGDGDSSDDNDSLAPDELREEEEVVEEEVDDINERFEQLLAEFVEELSDEDLLRRTHRPHIRTYPYAFLAAYKPKPYDCCINVCCCYTGSYAKLTACPFCKEPRRTADDRPRKQFNYMPLIPRLRAYFQNPEMVEKMRYRGDYQPDPSKVTDVMDGAHYQKLCDTNVVIDGIPRSYKFFSSWRDLLLGLSTDGFAPFRRRKKTCWPLLVYNYNLPPEIRFLLEHVICVGVIPGPKKPKDFDSFAWPLVQELLQLMIGVKAFDVVAKELFSLRAYLALGFGDMPAVSFMIRPLR
ncbi:hypothetical protein ONZ45_g11699 [Pleurotus djamor]|nr:hypothetical protein ONZ45_g11699 [Pleurotus djamor]